MASSTSVFEIGKNRIEALSDGIFAIVMTLLILEIHVPDLPPDAVNIEIAPALLALWPKFASYFVAFVSLGFLGRAPCHPSLHPKSGSAAFVAQYILLSVRLTAAVFHERPEYLSAAFVAPMFFGTNLAIVGWILFFQWTYASSQTGMLADGVSAEYRASIRFRMLLVPLATTVTVLICFWSVETSLAIYLVLLPLYVLPANSGGRMFTEAVQ